jgi:hypothetical protein
MHPVDALGLEHQVGEGQGEQRSHFRARPVVADEAGARLEGSASGRQHINPCIGHLNSFAIDPSLSSMQFIATNVTVLVLITDVPQVSTGILALVR